VAVARAPGLSLNRCPIRLDHLVEKAVSDQRVAFQAKGLRVMLTAHGTIPDAVYATQRGVFAYLTKPYDSKTLLQWIDQALRITAAAAPLPEPADQQDSLWRGDIITRSAAMEALLGRTWRVAQSEASVLIQGASGTGKELLARALHRASRRAARPFVGVNCTAIPESLLESELFGHCKGSFTGATHEHKGLFQSADGGTLLLDEIGDMPQGVQAKLLRALQRCHPLSTGEGGATGRLGPHGARGRPHHLGHTS
jgi:two-component system response regulator GlrR